MIKLYNHTNSPVWSDKNIAKGLQNGAKTYSQAITKYYYPVFEEFFKNDDKNTAVITVTTENKPVYFKEYNRIFLFMHECRYKQQPTIARAKNFANMNGHAEVWFVVWEESTAEVMRAQGLNAIFLPMAIDLEEVMSHKVNSIKNDRIIWFGQIRDAKKPFYRYFLSEARRQGLIVDTISGSRFNNGPEKMTREDIMRCLQYYKYGVGVGICAHEMSALGLRVFIYSYNFYCNCAYDKVQAKHYINRNLCSPEEAKITVRQALENRQNMVVIDPVDIKQNISTLRKELSKNFTPSK